MSVLKANEEDEITECITRIRRIIKTSLLRDLVKQALLDKINAFEFEFLEGDYK